MMIRDLGCIEYQLAHRLQREAVEQVRRGGPATVFVLEHFPVMTFGKGGGHEALPFPAAYFAERGVQCVSTNRGGKLTCHFPGQLVVYPVLKIDKRPGGLRLFFYDLEATVIDTLAALGLHAQRREGFPGVWLGTRKIASIGIAVEHWVTHHGLSLNVCPAPAVFQEIAPCGIADATHTSVHEELPGLPPTLPVVKDLFVQHFCHRFSPDTPLTVPHHA